MVNPALPKYQLVGVFNLEILLRLYSHFYQKSDKNIALFMTLGGVDELSLTNSAKIDLSKTEKFSTQELGLEIQLLTKFNWVVIPLKKASEISLRQLLWERNKMNKIWLQMHYNSNG